MNNNQKNHDFRRVKVIFALVLVSESHFKIKISLIHSLSHTQIYRKADIEGCYTFQTSLSTPLTF